MIYVNGAYFFVFFVNRRSVFNWLHRYLFLFWFLVDIFSDVFLTHIFFCCCSIWPLFGRSLERVKVRCGHPIIVIRFCVREGEDLFNINWGGILGNSISRLLVDLVQSYLWIKHENPKPIQNEIHHCFSCAYCFRRCSARGRCWCHRSSLRQYPSWTRRIRIWVSQSKQHQ